MLPFAPLSRRTALCLLAMAAAGATRAADGRPLRLLVAYPAGGPTDLLARQIEPLVGAALGRSIVVENVPGASGGLGVGRLLNPPDPAATAVLVGTPSETVLAPLVNTALPYRPDQLRLLALLSHVPVALVGGVHLTAPTVAELLDGRRAGDAPLSFAHYGVGSHGHLAAEDFTARAGIEATQVPYGGVVLAVRDLVGGRADLSFVPFNRATQELVDQGRLRLYGFASGTGAPRYPDAPRIDTWRGFTGFRHDLWTGAFVRRDTPPAQCAELRAALQAALADDAFRRLKADEGVVVASAMGERDADRWFDDEVARYRALATRLAPRLRG